MMLDVPCALLMASTPLLLLQLLLLQPQTPAVSATSDMVRLYDDLLYKYNRLTRPVQINSELVKVKMRLRLSQLIDVNMKNQVMTTSVWVDQEWTDYQLSWDPADYGNTTHLYVRSEDIWLPDIVLYNNADGNYEITINNTKAELSPSGTVKWSPPAVYKSYCQIDVEYFPFDEQNCIMKFGSWTYDDRNLDLRHTEQTNESDLDAAVQYGVDLQDYYLSVEWDLMEVPAQRHKVFYYSCCKESRYIDISFNITMRRKTVFYTVNLIIPCVGISCLTILVFYLPSESGEKVTLCVSVLLSLTVFVLLLAEIIPPTSLTVPLLGKYLLFTMVLVTLSVVSTICVLNIGFRSPSTHRLSERTRWLFLQFLPPLLLIRRPERTPADPLEQSAAGSDGLSELEVAGPGSSQGHHSFCTGFHPPSDTEILTPPHSPIPGPSGHPHLPAPGPSSAHPLPLPGPFNHRLPLPGPSDLPPPPAPSGPGPSCPSVSGQRLLSPPWFSTVSPGHGAHDVDSSLDSLSSFTERWTTGPPRPRLRDGQTWSEFASQHQHMRNTLRGVHTIASRISNRDAYQEVESDWQYVAMVLDRLFLWLFTLACVLGTCGILLQAPLLYDHTTPIDRIKSRVARADLTSMGEEEHNGGQMEEIETAMSEEQEDEVTYE